MPREIVEQHLPEALNRVTGVGLGMTWFSTGWAWLGSNQSSITSVCAIAGILLTAYGVFKRPK